MKPTAIVAGHICIDIFPDMSQCKSEQFKHGITPGHLIFVGAMNFSTGGVVSNTGLGLWKLGVPTLLMGKIGDDFLGQIVRQYLAQFGSSVSEGIVIDPASNTSYTIVISPPNVDRSFLHNPGANDTFDKDDIRYEQLEGAKLFHFGYPPLMKRMTEEGETQLPAIFRRAKEKGVITSMDMSFPDPASSAARAPWKTILSAALPYVDIFLPSIEEILLLLNRPLYDQMFQQSNNGDILPLITPEFLSTISQQLLEMGAKVVGFKCGYRGLYLRTADFSSIKALSQVLPIKSEEWAAKEHWEPCFKVNVVGTAGSGDATIAGFLCALLHGFSLEKAAEAAVAVGACCVEAADTVSGIRSWEETLKRIESGWQKLSL